MVFNPRASIMYLTAKMEQFSRAYVQAIAANIGCNSSKPEVDNDSVDMELMMKDIPGCRLSRGQLAIQLKCTHATDATKWKNNFPFVLPIKNYNDLRADVLVPRLLVVVCVPEKCDEWLWHTEEQLCLYHCAYWYSLAGKPEVPNKETITIHIPKINLFSPDFLREAMRRCANGETL